jgi:REP element-mobilizing transposase RayT
MANQTDSLAHTRWMCKYHIVFSPKYRRKVIFNQIREDVGEILKEQRDQAMDRLSVKEYKDPFGRKE